SPPGRAGGRGGAAAAGGGGGGARGVRGSAGGRSPTPRRPAEPWAIESLARVVSVSRATLARRFADLVGETPPEYLTRWRIDLAAQRLRDTDDTVGAIAAAVGYRSEYSFSRAFTRHRGIAPGRYRRRARASAARA